MKCIGFTLNFNLMQHSDEDTEDAEKLQRDNLQKMLEAMATPEVSYNECVVLEQLEGTYNTRERNGKSTSSLNELVYYLRF